MKTSNHRNIRQNIKFRQAKKQMLKTKIIVSAIFRSV